MKTSFETKELYEKIKEDKTHYSLIILVIASHGETYDLFSECWREYMNIFPDVKSYFIYADNSIESDVMIHENRIVFKNNDHVKSRIFQKTIAAFSFCQKYYQFDHLLRTNLSSFIHIPRLTKFLKDKPKENYVGAHFHQLPDHISQRNKQNMVNAYFSKELNGRFIYLHGAAMIFSKDIVIKVLLEMRTNYAKIEPILELPDDVVLSMVLYNFLTLPLEVDGDLSKTQFYHPREFQNLIAHKLDCKRLVDTNYYTDEEIFHIRNKIASEALDNSVDARSCDIMNYIYQIRHFYKKPKFMDYIDSAPQKKIVDAFMFYNELDMLKYRLTILAPHVDHFVLVESTRTFAGEPKPLFYKENKDKEVFKEFASKIIHVVVDDFTVGPDCHWENEKYQRNCLHRGIEQLDLQDSDYIMISDVDEIPDPKTLIALKQEEMHVQYANLKQDFYYYNLTAKMNEIWIRAKVITYEEYNNQGCSPDAIRLKTPPTMIEKGGWHLSYFGNTKMIQNKIRQFSHQEFNTEEITNADHLQQCIDNYTDILKRDGVKLIKIPIDSNFYLPPQHRMIHT
uniref:Fringe-like glycosyltransferase domain-containing protein n=1 Tax=viral metagenome TaxID=1070528 RepID=A0A6C0I2Y0_9ZZZZ